MFKYKVKLCIALLIVISLLFPLNTSVLSLSNESECRYVNLAESISGDSAYKYLETLCSDEFEGRQSGAEGSWRAAEWIADLYEGFGLKPAGDDNTYFQNFEVPLFNIIAPMKFSIKYPDNTEDTIEYKHDYVVSPGSGSGSVNSEIIFTGYGISSPNNYYDDYKGIDVKGKIVLIMRKSPTFADFGDIDPMFTTKINNAQNHGAIGVIIAEKATEKNRFSMNTKSVSGSNGVIPALFVTTSAANRILKSSNIDLFEIEEKIDETSNPFSFTTKVKATMNINVRSENVKTANVIGYVEGSDPESEESIIITAHYDHLGKDDIDGSIYRGANDNASGTAVLLEFAHALASNCVKPKINIVFIAFSGEEEGLLGSYHYIKNPIFPLNKTLAVLNMDMVGTGTGNLIAGTDPYKYSELGKVITASNNCLKINTPFNKGLLRSGSDHLFFDNQKIPVVFFIRSNPTGIGGYHTTNDTIDSVDPKNLYETGIIIFMITAIYSNPEFITFDQYYWQEGITYHPKIIISGYITDEIKVKINNNQIKNKDNTFESIFNIENGDNLIEISVYKYEDLVYERTIKIKGIIDNRLKCDFNFDFNINLDDLIDFSFEFDKTVVPFSKDELYDIDSDGIINVNDLSFFNSNFGYTRKLN